MEDNWINKSEGMLCRTCMFFVAKAKEGELVEVGRCRRHAPTMSGYPVVFVTDWCGDHKLVRPRRAEYTCINGDAGFPEPFGPKTKGI